jgi:hypothetical protein
LLPQNPQLKNISPFTPSEMMKQQMGIHIPAQPLQVGGGAYVNVGGNGGGRSFSNGSFGNGDGSFAFGSTNFNVGPEMGGFNNSGVMVGNFQNNFNNNGAAMDGGFQNNGAAMDGGFQNNYSGNAAMMMAAMAASTGSLGPANSPPGVSPSNAGGVAAKRCRHFMKGRCTWGATCRFVHEFPSPLARTGPHGAVSVRVGDGATPMTPLVPAIPPDGATPPPVLMLDAPNNGMLRCAMPQMEQPAPLDVAAEYTSPKGTRYAHNPYNKEK